MAKTYKVRPICIHCGKAIKWFEGVQTWLHIETRKARCVGWIGIREAAPVVKEVKILTRKTKHR